MSDNLVFPQKIQRYLKSTITEEAIKIRTWTIFKGKF